MDAASVIAAARAWIGTPYLHGQSVKDHGCDCLGLVRGVWRDLYGAEPEKPPPYSPDWGERHGVETLIEAAARHLVAVDPAGGAVPGDVLIYRMRPGRVAKHCAFLIAGTPAAGRIVHAYGGHAVCETATLKAAVAAAFRFP